MAGAAMTEIGQRFRHLFDEALVEGTVTVVLRCADERDKFRLKAAIMREFAHLLYESSAKRRSAAELSDSFKIAGTEFILRTLDQR